MAYDHCAIVTRRPRLTIIERPVRLDGNKFQAMSDRFGPCVGKVHFARRDKVNFEVWVRKEFRRGTDWIWVRKYWVSSNGILKDVPKCFYIMFRIDEVYFPPLFKIFTHGILGWFSRPCVTRHFGTRYGVRVGRRRKFLRIFGLL